MKYLFIISFIVACGSKPPSGSTQVMDFKFFTMEAPAGWKYIKRQGIDSNIGKIDIGSGESLEFDLGWYSNDLSENEHKHNITWHTIDGRRAKIVSPKKSGDGMTGVYFDSLWTSNNTVDRFNLVGFNLKPEQEKEVLHAIRTLKFREEY